ncbi:hypothetical protein SELMODRAFT_432497 [Selaginella moellendorffii]|uniref:Uncharacterized protein n=1 Tax=Selaginella moellendorffii TaxID=88036 RepID=D8TG65_SELML|nr:hypothetical protein SELMODRAFT_432497 [Selaginella moellendorffii]
MAQCGDFRGPIGQAEEMLLDLDGARLGFYSHAAKPGLWIAHDSPSARISGSWSMVGRMRDERQLPHRKRTFDRMLGDVVGDVEVDIDGDVEVDVDGFESVMVGECDDEQEEEVEEDEDEEEDEDYALRFEGDMDPLAFVDVDQNGDLPYQQFERLEYEALAERKRKALAKKREEEEMNAKESQQDIFGADIDDIWNAFGPKRRRRAGEAKRKGRKKVPGIPGASRLPPEVSRKLGEANLLYATRKNDEAIALLKEVVRLAPNAPDAYHTLGLLYDAMGDRKKALNFYMICAHLKPKDAALWKRLASWSTELGNTGQVIHCLTKAIRADPDDIDAKWDRASLYAEILDFQKAADAFEQMLVLRSSDVEVCKMVAKMQHKNGNIQRATEVLEKFIDEHSAEADFAAVNLLAELHMGNRNYAAALSQIDRARQMYCHGQALPLDLSIKSGICHVHLGNLLAAERDFEDLRKEGLDDLADLVLDVGDTYLSVGRHHDALGYYIILEGNDAYDNGTLSLKIAECYMAVDALEDAIRVYYRVMEKLPQHVDARLTLASLLLRCSRLDDAINLLKPPQVTDTSVSGLYWWQNGRIKMKLAEIYHGQGKLYLFLETILPAIQESLYVESFNQKVKGRKRLPKSVLAERAKLLEDKQDDEVFQGFGPIISRNDRAKASRAKKVLAKRAAEKEEKKAAALAAGMEWESEEESDGAEAEMELKQSPLPNLLKDDEHYQTLLQACKALASIQRYWEALEVIHHSLRVGNSLTPEQHDELRALGAQIAYKTSDARYGYECARYMVQQRPYSLSMWNCYYQVVSRSEARVPRHHKFMLQMRNKFADCVPAMIICGHQFAMISQSQGALREYLQAYKQQPEDPFINLCVGVSFINLSQGFRLSNRNQCVLQGFAFLYKYQRLSNHNQESNYNIARAYHCVGLVHLAVTYYEKVLQHFEKDRPIVRLPYESSTFLSQDFVPEGRVGGHCDLRREAAHNLHLIYKKSGSLHLARQVLMDYCRP